jgi:hypothetical protein
MPQHTIKSKAEKKRIVLAEPATSKAKKVGFLKVPIHLSKGPQRLPINESEYIHRSRPVAAPLSKGQVQAIAAWKRGANLPTIAQSSGLPIGTLVKTLKTVGLSEETHKQELEQLEIWYKNRRNP